MSSTQGARPATGLGSAPSAERWLALCRAAVSAQREIFAAHAGIGARTEYEGKGEGGDWALVIDRRCEDVVFELLDELAAEGHAFTAVSEERGEVRFGPGDSRLRVVIDPIDGSMNARRTIPSHCLSLAVADGPSMADVRFGFVHDFGADEEFVAVRGQGARLDGEPIRAESHVEGLEVVGIEAAKPEITVPVVDAMRGEVYRLRCIGAIAITLAYVAAGRLDGMLSLRPCRSVDAAAAQLIAREAGGEVCFGDLRLADADLGLDARYQVAGARGAQELGSLREMQRAGERA